FFDRIILHIISVRFFDKDAGLKTALQGIGKSLCRGLTGDLLWRRLSPVRSAVMPVRVLERNLKTGREIALRKTSLKKGGTDYGILLTLWAISVEAALLAGEIIFFISIAQLFAPGFLNSINNPLDLEIFFYAAWCLNFILVETIYVCMGFSLYINGRIQIEGWDLEIKFRAFSRRRQAVPPRQMNQMNNIINSGKNIVLVTAVIFALFLMPENIYADDDPPYEILQTILDSPDFGGEEETWSIRFKNNNVNNNDINVDSELIERIQKISARILQIILIVIIAGTLVLLFIYFKKYKYNKPDKKNYATQKIILKNQTENPEYLLEKALNYHEKGELRLSWGYCAAAAIKSWTVCKNIAFPPDAAETDCAAIINSMNGESQSAQNFDRLIKNWVYLVYAGKVPPDGSFNEAVDFVKAQYG
ncbi:MAG: hypothetical protein FWC17_02825, partial [Treponema sp.]|nr:hypothetical protein [Treponema sp.]